MPYNEFTALFQRRAAAAGYYTAKIDGLDGPGTRKALDLALPELVVLPKVFADDIPDLGDTKLKGVHEALANVIKAASLVSPVKFTVIEGLRSASRQASLVAAGASKTSNSRHLTGHAVDLWPLDSKGKLLPSDAQFKPGTDEAKQASANLWAALRQIATTVKQAAKDQGVLVEWGGDWEWDGPHFQLNRKAYPA